MVLLGQQVTGYGHADENNMWQIVPTKALSETGRGRIVRHNDVIQLLHVTTDTYLLTYDVASPLMPTNQEFTTWARDDCYLCRPRCHYGLIVNSFPTGRSDSKRSTEIKTIWTATLFGTLTRLFLQVCLCSFIPYVYLKGGGR
jgi:dolichyl-phosphate-mannose-protein mannosyltransferase